MTFLGNLTFESDRININLEVEFAYFIGKSYDPVRFRVQRKENVFNVIMKLCIRFYKTYSE